MVFSSTLPSFTDFVVFSSAIPYGQLKKCIKKVESELRSIGLDSATLAQLIPETDEEWEAAHRGGGVAFQYNFDGMSSPVDHP